MSKEDNEGKEGKEGNEGGIDLGSDDFPTRSDIDAWEFYTSPSNEAGESDVINARVEPEVTRRISELIQLAKEKGVHALKTPSDFIRFAIIRELGSVASYLDINDESLTHWLLLEKQAMKRSYESSMLVRVRETVRAFQSGVEVLTQDSRKDWEEARVRISNFLKPVMNMAGGQDFLMKMYVRELFRNKSFQRSLEKIEREVSLGSVIENARKAYERLTGKGEEE